MPADDIDAVLRRIAARVPFNVLCDYADELDRLHAQGRNGSLRIEHELSFGRVADGWLASRVRPRRKPAR